MQSLWKQELQWDQILAEQQLKAWNDYYYSLPDLNSLCIARYVNYFQNKHQIIIFGFGDASQQAFGACLYAVSISKEGYISLHLCAKAKVAPLKTISLPRLELEAALLLAQLCKTVKAAYENKIHRFNL